MLQYDRVPLHYSAYFGNSLPVLELLLEKIADVNAQDMVSGWLCLCCVLEIRLEPA